MIGSGRGSFQIGCKVFKIRLQLGCSLYYFYVQLKKNCPLHPKLCQILTMKVEIIKFAVIGANCVKNNLSKFCEKNY